MSGEGILPTDGAAGINLDDFSNVKFDFTPDTSQGKIVITIHGPKNAGKSTGVFLVTTGRLGGFRNGKTLAISFDDKTKTTFEQFFKDEPITIQDGTKYYSEDPLTKTKSGYMTYMYLQELLKYEAKNNYDWVFFDGLTVLSEILEMSMRYINGLKPTQGFANRNIWKDRGSMLRTLHNLAAKMANIGVVYSTYSEKDEIIKDGETVSKEDIPKYLDVVMLKTDVVLKATKGKGKNGNMFFLTVEGTKFKQYYDHGVLLPITDRTLKEGIVFDVTGMSEQIKPESAIVVDQKVSIQQVVEAKKTEPAQVLQAAPAPQQPVQQTQTQETVSPAPVVEKKPEPVVEKKKDEVKITNKKAAIPDLLSL